MKVDLVVQIIRNPTGPLIGDLAHRLLCEFLEGRPLADIQPLLAVPRTQDAACWILTEIGESARLFVLEVAPLLSSPRWQVRVGAVDFVLSWATSVHGDALARATLLLEDDNVRVRWRCARLLLTCAPEQLRAAAEAFPRIQHRTDCHVLVDYLIRNVSEQATLHHLARESSRVLRLCAMMLAFRNRWPRELVLELASIAGDEEVTKLADDALHRRLVAEGDERRGNV